MKKTSLLSTLLAFIMLLSSCNLFTPQNTNGNQNQENNNNTNIETNSTPSSIEKFSSKEELLAYLENAQSQGSYYGFNGFERAIPTMAVEDIAVPTGAIREKSISPTPASTSSNSSSGSGGVDRVSSTNVQVLGIDEADVLKTDGNNIFLSLNQLLSPYYISEKMIAPPYREQKGEIKIIKANPVKDMSLISSIDKQGEMLLFDNMLIVLSDYDYTNNKRFIYGFDVTDPKNPKKEWTIKLKDREIVTSRLYNGKIYLVTQNQIEYANPCPIIPLSVETKDKENSIEIPCGDIYHPARTVDNPTTYNAFIVDPKDGSIEKKLSFLGSSQNTIVYMSKNNLYISYFYSDDTANLLADFITKKGKDIFPADVILKIKKILTYDISNQGKISEINMLIEKYLRNQDADEQKRIETEMQNKLSEYTEEHKRELGKTGIAKIDVNNLEIVANGEVPGRLLNQFSLDEYEKTLRVATTIDERFSNLNMFFYGMNIQSVSDVYTLDEKMNVLGSIKNLGETERIYSVRFLGNKGYVVTFRQTDPFYVLDLKDPKNPAKKGELKIPGYSSYLHPLKDDIILGVGQDNGKVKLSLFYVTDPSNPKEISKYMLDEYWTEVGNNHHAFLQDSKYEVFFLPASQSGYILSYKNNELSLKKVISGIAAKRSLFINNYLYIVGETGIVVFDENNGEKVKEFDFAEDESIKKESEKEEIKDEQPLIGGEKDEHGCLIAAGYSWCEMKQKCLRTWEETCETLVPVKSK